MSVDLTGSWFGALCVVERAPGDKRYKNAMWRCECRCGRQVVCRGDKLKQNKRQSCGRRGCAKCLIFTVANDEYNAWHNMLARCYKKKHVAFHNYGGKGIVVCDRWRKSFENFLSDVGPRPSPKHQLDRHPDPNGNYEPGNCRWATKWEQMHNLRNSVYVEYEGERLALAALVQKLGLSRSVVYSRLRLGWTLENALSVPTRKSIRSKNL